MKVTLLAGNATDATSKLLHGKESEKNRTISTEPATLWYLAYGSNLNSSVFRVRRGVKPLEERHVLVEGLELTFDLPGIPYIEPRFANCRFASSVDFEITGNGKLETTTGEWDLNATWTGRGALIGVAYLLTAKDFARVVATEGGGSGYEMMAVEGKVFTAKDEKSSDLGDNALHRQFAFTGEIVRALTLMASAEKTRACQGQPSRRYLKLIQEGAKEHQLPTKYISYLSSLTPYTITTTRQKVASVLFPSIWAPPFLVAILLGLVFAKKDGTYPNWLLAVRTGIQKRLWGSYDGFFWRWFGEGEQTIGSDTARSQ